MTPRAIGIDIGTTFVKAVLVIPEGEILSRMQVATDTWQQQVVQIVNQLEREFGPVPAIGICGPGIGSPDGRCISWMIGSMAGLTNFDFTTHLGRAFSPAPGMPGEGNQVRPGFVPVLNDAMAALLAELWLGAARGISDAVLLTLGTGIGGAIMCNGKILKGHTGRAGHLGHVTIDAFGPLDICNTPGSIENAIGNHTIMNRSGGQFASTEDLVAAYESGDGQACDIWLGSIRKLAAAITSIINIVDPQRIIIGGGMIHAGESLFAPLRAELNRVEWRPIGAGVEIVPAELGEWAGAIGSAYNAMQATVKQ